MDVHKVGQRSIHGTKQHLEKNENILFCKLITFQICSIMMGPYFFSNVFLLHM